MKIKGALLLLGLLCCPFLSWAAKADDSNIVQVSLAAPPTASIIDRQCEKSQMLEYEVKIKNNTEFKAGLYALVYDINPEGTFKYYNDPSELDPAVFITPWVNFQRGVIEIEPFAEVSKTLKINISPVASEGKYHAVIILAQGSTQVGAAQVAEKVNAAKIFLNLEVKSHTIEKAEITEFGPKTAVLTRSPLEFNLKIKNIGNTPVSPAGEVILYTKNGKELSSAKISETEIAPNNIESFPVKINFVGAPGRYKAKFFGEYGEDKNDLQDIIYFLYLPTKLLTVIVILILAGLIWLTVLINKRKKRPPVLGQTSDKPVRDYVINLKK